MRCVDRQLLYVMYNCSHCGELLGPYYQDNIQQEVKPTDCPECQSSGPFVLNPEKVYSRPAGHFRCISSQTVYRNYQKVTLQESPGPHVSCLQLTTSSD